MMTPQKYHGSDQHVQHIWTPLSLEEQKNCACYVQMSSPKELPRVPAMQAHSHPPHPRRELQRTLLVAIWVRDLRPSSRGTRVRAGA